MVDKRPRFGIPNPKARSTDWEDDYYKLTLVVDQYLLERGDTANRPTEGEYHGEVYADIESGLIQYWDADTGSWNTLASDVAAGFGLTKSSGTLIVDAGALAGSGLAEDGSGRLELGSGINADTVDGYNGSELGVLDESEHVTATWRFSGSVSVDSNLYDRDTIDIIYNKSEAHVPISILEHNSLSVAGNSVSLGGSTSVSHSDLNGIGGDDHHTDPSAGSGLVDEGDNQFGLDSPASGTTTLSGGSIVVDTGHPIDNSAEYTVFINPDDGADLAASLEEGGSNYQIHLEENTTSVGNPDCRWRLVRFA